MLISRWKNTALISIAIVVVAVFILLSMGRVPFCKCGTVAFWSSDVQSNQQSQQLTDPYTLTHVIHGALLYAIIWLAFRNRVSAGVRFMIAVALESGWEILENTDYIINRYREATISLDYYGDSILNSTGDILAMMFGYWLALKLPGRFTAIIVVGIEILLLVTIKDSLLVNIIMLILPVDAIKQWQLH